MINQNQIYAYQAIANIEELYFSSLNSSTDADIRTEIEPLRQAIEFLRQSYSLTNETDVQYDTYVRSIRNLHLHQDRIQNLANNGTNN